MPAAKCWANPCRSPASAITCRSTTPRGTASRCCSRCPWARGDDCHAGSRLLRAVRRDAARRRRAAAQRTGKRVRARAAARDVAARVHEAPARAGGSRAGAAREGRPRGAMRARGRADAGGRHVARALREVLESSLRCARALSLPPGAGRSMAETEDKPVLDIERRYDAPPEKVWQAWTDPQALSRWFGPAEEGSVTQADLDV